MTRVLSIDPGNNKCGLLLADISEQVVLEGKVVRKELVINIINSWLEKTSFERIFLGNGTSSDFWKDYLTSLIVVPIQIVEEKGTTIRARERYWELWPPNRFLKVLPRGLLLPPDQLDAVAALVLLEDCLNRKFQWPQKPNFRIEP